MQDVIQVKVDNWALWGSRIKEVRSALGYSIDTMAQRLNIDSFILNLAERGKTYVPALIKNILDPQWNVNEEWFFEGALPMFKVSGDVESMVSEKNKPDKDEITMLRHLTYDHFETIRGYVQTEEDNAFADLVQKAFGEGSHIGMELLSRNYDSAGSHQVQFFEDGVRHGVQLLLDMLCKPSKQQPTECNVDIQRLANQYIRNQQNSFFTAQGCS